MPQRKGGLHGSGDFRRRRLAHLADDIAVVGGIEDVAGAADIGCLARRSAPAFPGAFSQ
jgi:hypothetical protein